MASHIIIDDFLSDFDSFREYCDGLDYSGVTSHFDDIFYSGISPEVPDHIKAEVVERLEKASGKKVDLKTIFLRLSLDGYVPPQQAHTDMVISRWGVVIYLNRLEDCIGGTSFVCHKKTGLCENPANQKQLDVWEKDKNNSDAWGITEMAPMLPNRGVIINGEKMHRSEPVGGFGSDATDGRLVLTAFFND